MYNSPSATTAEKGQEVRMSELELSCCWIGRHCSGCELGGMGTRSKKKIELVVSDQQGFRKEVTGGDIREIDTSP